MAEKKNNTLWILLFLPLVLMGMDGRDQEHFERRLLLEQRKTLTNRVEQLKQEQDYLLFQKAFSTADSKYLVLDLTAGRGELRYKQIILKNFTFTPLPAAVAKKIPAGALTLTAKKERAGGRISLVFGKTLVIRPGSRPQSGSRDRAVRIFLKKKDFTSLLYAVEEGGQAYIKPAAVGW